MTADVRVATFYELTGILSSKCRVAHKTHRCAKAQPGDGVVRDGAHHLLQLYFHFGEQFRLLG
jgi:hypothetical protein